MGSRAPRGSSQVDSAGRRLNAPAGMAVHRFDTGGSEFAIFEWPIRGPPTDWVALTLAERHVVELALEGCSNKEIAVWRGCSIRTVANELRSAYQKLGIRCRAELSARAAWGGG